MKGPINLNILDSTIQRVMKKRLLLLLGVIIFVVLISGCTSQPAATVPPTQSDPIQQSVVQQTSPAPSQQL